MNDVLVHERCATCDAVSGLVRLRVELGHDGVHMETETPEGWRFVRYVGDVCPACWLERSKWEENP